MIILTLFFFAPQNNKKKSDMIYTEDGLLFIKRKIEKIPEIQQALL